MANDPLMTDFESPFSEDYTDFQESPVEVWDTLPTEKLLHLFQVEVAYFEGRDIAGVPVK